MSGSAEDRPAASCCSRPRTGVAECACGILVIVKRRDYLGMWHLIEDFFEQGVVVKLSLAVGWLALVIMIASLIDLLLF